MNRLCAADPIVQRLPIENPETAMRRVLFSLLLLLTLHAARADALWQTLPPTPPFVSNIFRSSQPSFLKAAERVLPGRYSARGIPLEKAVFQGDFAR